MYPLFRDVSDPYQHTLWVKYVLYTHIIAFIIKSNWKLSQNLHTWTTQYVHFQCGIYWPKPVVLASSSTSIYSKWSLCVALIPLSPSHLSIRKGRRPWLCLLVLNIRNLEMTFLSWVLLLKVPIHQYNSGKRVTQLSAVQGKVQKCIFPSDSHSFPGTSYN